MEASLITKLKFSVKGNKHEEEVFVTGGNEQSFFYKVSSRKILLRAGGPIHTHGAPRHGRRTRSQVPWTEVTSCTVRMGSCTCQHHPPGGFRS